jgi:hypothetical protein
MDKAGALVVAGCNTARVVEGSMRDFAFDTVGTLWLMTSALGDRCQRR